MQTRTFRKWVGRAALAAGALLASLVLPSAHPAELLDPADAFKFSAAVGDDGKSVAARFSIADGYYLYRERFGFAASDGVQIGAPQYPPGEIKYDATFNRELEVYRGNLLVNLPLRSGSGAFTLTARLQGCADQGVCYPPEARTATLVLTMASNGSASPGAAPASAGSPPAESPDLGRIAAALESGSLPTVLPIFFVLGLLLSFTPCVLPMVPILSSIIVGEGGRGPGSGEGAMTRTRGLVLASAYALGMAIVYTVFGVAAGLAGEGLTGALQQPWALAVFAGLLAALALSLFGLYELQLPSAWQTRIARASAGIVGGKIAGVFAMGALSALIVGPCVAAPLAGALLYISQTRDVVIGGGALFAMAAGMSVPLLLLGGSAGALLPRAGPWMESVKRFFGALLTALALWTISPAIPVWAQMLAWAALLIIGAAYLGVFNALPRPADGWPRLRKAVGAALLLLGALEIVGVASGGRDVLLPLAHLASARGAAARDSQAWTPVASVEQLDAALAGADGRPLVLDFYADWCVSCKEMDRFTYADARVAARLSAFRLLRVDVTSNGDQAKALLKRFRLFGPPATIFFDSQGREVRTRVIGFESADRFLATLERAVELAAES